MFASKKNKINYSFQAILPWSTSLWHVRVGLYLTFINHYLISLVNRIGDDGVHGFLEAIKLQEMYSQLGIGLLKITLHHNLASDKSPDMNELNNLLAKKDASKGNPMDSD